MTNDRIVRMPEVRRLTGLSTRTIQRKVNKGTFPPKRRLSAHCVGWLLSEVLTWIANPQ